jgi:UDP-glucose 4-epimerase
MLSKATKGENITLYGDGSVRRTLIYMGDLCNILIAGALSNKCCNDVFNVGGEDYSLKEIAELIATKYGVGIDYISWPQIAEKIESGDTVFDSSKIEQRIICTYSQFKQWIR